MARIYTLRKSDEIPECQLLSLFNQAVAIIFKPKKGPDPAIVICDLVARTIAISGDNPHSLSLGKKKQFSEMVEAV